MEAHKSSVLSDMEFSNVNVFFINEEVASSNSARVTSGFFFWQRRFMHMPVNAAFREVIRSPGKAAPLEVLCFRVGAEISISWLLPYLWKLHVVLKYRFPDHTFEKSMEAWFFARHTVRSKSPSIYRNSRFSPAIHITHEIKHTRSQKSMTDGTFTIFRAQGIPRSGNMSP